MTSDVAVLFSFMFFLIGVSHVVAPKPWTDFFRDLAKQSYCGLVIAMYSLPVGLVILSYHNNWELGFPLFITLAGWFMIIKSILYLMFPDLPAQKFIRKAHFTRQIQAIGFAMMLLGGLSGLSYYW